MVLSTSFQPLPYVGKVALLAYDNNIFKGFSQAKHDCPNSAWNLSRQIPIQPNCDAVDYQGSDQKLPFRTNEARTEWKSDAGVTKKWKWKSDSERRRASLCLFRQDLGLVQTPDVREGSKKPNTHPPPTQPQTSCQLTLSNMGQKSSGKSYKQKLYRDWTKMTKMAEHCHMQLLSCHATVWKRFSSIFPICFAFVK